MTTKIWLDGKEYIVPNEIIKNSHVHHQPKKWVALWFYKNNQKELIFPDDISEDIDDIELDKDPEIEIREKIETKRLSDSDED